MNDCGYQSLRVEAQAMIENEQTPFLCFHFDKMSQRVFIMADSESLKKVQELSALLDIENIVKTTFEEGKNLNMYDQKFETEKPSCVNRSTGIPAQHTCHIPKPKFQLSWEKALPGCFENREAPTEVNYERLPREILMCVFGFLSPSDLKCINLVSKHWKSVAEEPSLWKEFGLPNKCRRSEINFTKFFETSISSKLQILSLNNFFFQLNDDHFQSLQNLELKTISIENIDLFNVSDDNLAQLVNNSKECVIREHSAKLKTENGNNINVLGLNKLKTIFRKMESGTKLKSLTLSCVAASRSLDLSFIPSSTLANALNKLESLTMAKVKLRESQLKTIFDYMSVKSKLKCLDLERFEMELASNVFGQAFCNLTELALNGLNQDKSQVRHLVEILDKSCKLQTLVLRHFDLTEIPPGLLARVFTKVNCVELDFVKVTVQQLNKIFETIPDTSSALEHLSLSDNSAISGVNPELLAKGVNNLKYFDFGNLDSGIFSETQTKEIFKVMSQGTKLKMLGVPSYHMKPEWIDHINTIDPEILSKAVHNLEEVMLDLEAGVYMTASQYMAIFKRLGEKTNLRKVGIDEEDFLL